MITVAHAQMMARYNSWQNQNIVVAADTLNDAQRCEDMGAFFGSMQNTLNHLLWADEMWLHRLSGRAAPEGKSIPESLKHTSDWETFKKERARVDDAIIAWADALQPENLQGKLKWFSGGAQRHFEQPIWMLVTHMFNHQTHHRGQVHCLLTQAGIKPADTDIPLMSGHVE